MPPIRVPDSKVHGANMGPIWGQQDPGWPHVRPMNFAIWGHIRFCVDNVVEDEYHLFFSCNLYNDLRSSLFDYLRQDVPDFDTLDLNDKMIYLMSRNAMKKTAEFVFRAMEIRRSVLYKKIKHSVVIICPYTLKLHVFSCIFMHIDLCKLIHVIVYMYS